MNLQNIQKILVALALAVVLTVTTACGGTVQSTQPGVSSGNGSTVAYQQLERGNTSGGQNFGDWVVQAGGGLISDAYVRDDNKLGAVISSQVRPNEVRPLARSLTQGLQRNFPNRDLTVFMYAPDKKLILTARYDHQTRQIEYQ
ncbi:hypothetical protein H6G89_07450 [Oscillatoria sp. FACHB-1407]|uniref:hypothetical protein n=1 Tax=Oscillatoria sp. FACHB-1407 TaxID=2692847 RepID=UPI00168291EE|nr:hypothetical protein [Oscillatoria sp. FACHB-1407]MBD2460877.1 hypothetical protein [Oscillatoria sp. FACHB-1407]